MIEAVRIVRVKLYLDVHQQGMYPEFLSHRSKYQPEAVNPRRDPRVSFRV